MLRPNIALLDVPSLFPDEPWGFWDVEVIRRWPWFSADSIGLLDRGISGVYALTNGAICHQEISYVGISRCLRRRLKEHNAYKAIDYVHILPVAMAYAVTIEREILFDIAPPLNRAIPSARSAA